MNQSQLFVDRSLLIVVQLFVDRSLLMDLLPLGANL